MLQYSKITKNKWVLYREIGRLVFIQDTRVIINFSYNTKRIFYLILYLLQNSLISNYFKNIVLDFIQQILEFTFKILILLINLTVDLQEKIIKEYLYRQKDYDICHNSIWS